MASLTKKHINGRAYWYLRETAWVDGRSKVVKTVYLGSADEVAAALGKGTTSLQVVPGAPVFEFGAAAGLYDLAQRPLPDQLLKRRCDPIRELVHDVPLRRGRQGNVEIPLGARPGG